MTDAPRVLSIVGDETGPTLWRVLWPHTALREKGYTAEWIYRKDPLLIDPLFDATVPLRYDAILTSRLSWEKEEAGRRFTNAMHRAHLPVIMDTDDDMYSEEIVDSQFDLYESQRAKGKDALELERLARIEALRLCDGITCGSKRLATVVRQYVDVPVCVVENAIDAEHYKRALLDIRRIPELQGKTTIGWMGGARYEDDLKPMADAWRIIAQRHPDVEFVVQGWLPPILANAVPSDRLTLLPWLDIEQYMRAMVNIDIGCASVADRHFNRCKTPIKWMEYTLAGAAVVASAALYGSVVEHGGNGMIATTAPGWADALGLLVAFPEMRRNLFRNARREVMAHHEVHATCERWLDAWATIIENYRERSRRDSAVISLAR